MNHSTYLAAFRLTSRRHQSAQATHPRAAATRLLRPRRLMPESQRSGGARGGKDQFSWDSVRQDKECDNYLGASIHASRGRWQKGKDLGWYAKGRKDENIAALAEEKRLVKEQEEDMMRQRLGLKPIERKERAVTLDKHEVKELLKGKQDVEESAEKGATRYDDERIGGIGSFSAARHGSTVAPTERSSKMAPEDRLEGTPWEEPAAPPPPRTYGAAAAPSGPSAQPDGSSSDESEASGAKKRKRSKEEKKAHKKEKKRRKHEKKEKKRRRHDSE